MASRESEPTETFPVPERGATAVSDEPGTNGTQRLSNDGPPASPSSARQGPNGQPAGESPAPESSSNALNKDAPSESPGAPPEEAASARDPQEISTSVVALGKKIPASISDLDGPTLHAQSAPAQTEIAAEDHDAPAPERATTVKFQRPVDGGEFPVGGERVEDDPLADASASAIPPAPFDLPPDAVPAPVHAEGFAPPAIPGLRNEVTRPLRISPIDGEDASDDGDAESDDLGAGDDEVTAAISIAPTSAGGSPPRIKSASFETPDFDPPEFDAPELDTNDIDSNDLSATEGLLDELGPLSEKTVDIDIPLLTKEMESGSSPSTEEGRTLEGAPQPDEARGAELTPPAAGAVVKSDAGEDITLTVSLGDQRGSVFYRASIDGDPSPYTAVWTPHPRPEPPWTTLPDPRVVRPRAVARLENAAIRVFERPKGNTVVDYLLDPDRFLPAMATLELGLELAEMLESLHGAGLFLYDLDPSQVVIEKSGRVRLYPISGFYRAQDLPQVAAGTFAAPEVRRGLRYRVGAHSDVFAVALVLYALLARRSPLEEDLDPAKLVNPRTFRPECPLGIWPHLQSCLDPSPSSRVGHARGLRALLEKARDRLLEEAQAADEPAPVVLEAWAEVHTGLAKARRGAPQQDRAIGVTDEEGTVGLYLIADGVSRSKFGDGAFAAEQVKQASYQRWTALEKAGPAALALSHAQRQDVLRQIARSAGKRVATEVNSHWAPIPNEPNQVMSSTLVAAFVVGGEATIANLGDSRAYLVRKGEIEQISIDHDRTTDGLRMGLSFKEASEMRMGSALTRVVGRVVIDDEGSCRPDPFEPEVFRLRLLPGDRLVLCSDGVADFAAGPGAPTVLAERAMRDVVEEYEDPVRAAFELVVLANRAGGYDNISCVVIAAHPG